MRKAKQLYEDFHSYPPKRVGAFEPSFSIPTEIPIVGAATHVLYSSLKVDPGTGVKPKKPVNYIHDHDSGVSIYMPDGDGPVRSVPKRIWGATELVFLGKCLGFGFIDWEGQEMDADFSKPLPELYCTPDGRSLLVIEGKRDLIALVWGGKLGVEPRGIVH